MALDFDLDFAVQKWHLAEQMAFEAKVGMTVYKAWDLLPDEGQAFDVPANVVVGFAWIAARRKDPDLTFEEVAEQVTLEDFVAAMERIEVEVPLENREQRRSSAKSSGRSATTSTTPRRKSAS